MDRMDISLRNRWRNASGATLKFCPAQPEKGLKMESEIESLKQNKSGDNEAGNEPQHGHLVEITLDGTLRRIEKGKYIVSALKAKLSVPAEYELDLVVDGQFKALADDAEIKIKGGEVLVSHVRRGGSS